VGWGFGDDEIRRFVHRATREVTFSELARQCRERFGPDRAWSARKIAIFWHRTRRPRWSTLSRIEVDPEVRDFVDDRLGLFTIDRIRSLCLARFGRERAPSKSAIGRYWLRARDRARQEEL
jgi:hypothetical protein